MIGVDYRGHGRSGWEPPWSVEQHVADLVETSAALGITGAAWLGHSFGGKLVAELSARHPDLVERAILLDPAMHVEPAVAGERADLARADVSFAHARRRRSTRASATDRCSRRRGISWRRRPASTCVEGSDGRYRWEWSPAAVIVAWSEMASQAPPWPRCPTLVVCGERSWIRLGVPRIGNIAQVLVPGGHSVLWDDFDATADAIVRFLG